MNGNDAYDVMPLARRLFPNLTGGPRFWWTPSDSSFLADADNGWCIWDRMGWRFDFERRWENLFVDTPRQLMLDGQGRPPGPPHIEKSGAYWEAEGFSLETIEHFGLGHMAVPGAWTIPVFDADGKCSGVRARLADKEKGYDGKYITLPPSPRVELFRAEREAVGPIRIRDYGEVLFVSGEKKAMRLWQEGFTAYSSTGGYAFPWRWLPFFRRFARVYVLFDPFEWWAAKRVAYLIGDKAWMAWLPEDVDEWFKKGGTAKLFREWLGRAEPVSAYRWPVHPLAPPGLAINELPQELWRCMDGLEDG